MPDYNSLKQEVIALCHEAGSFIETEQQRFKHDNIMYKGKNDLVSYVDKETEKMLVEGLKTLLPEAGFIAEEGTSSTRGEKYNWIIDPLDGTTNFLHHLPVYSISIGLIEDNEVVLGVIYDPSRNECFHTSKGAPSFLNQDEITISSVDTLAKSLLATGFPYTEFDKMENYLRIIHHFMQQSHGLRRMGSAAIDLAYVACGRFEGFFEYNLKPWDVAAGVLLVKNAGGKLTDFSGGDNYVFGGEIIAAGNPHNEILEVIRQFWNQ